MLTWKHEAARGKLLPVPSVCRNEHLAFPSGTIKILNLKSSGSFEPFTMAPDNPFTCTPVDEAIRLSISSHAAFVCTSCISAESSPHHLLTAKKLST